MPMSAVTQYIELFCGHRAMIDANGAGPLNLLRDEAKYNQYLSQIIKGIYLFIHVMSLLIFFSVHRHIAGKR